MRSPDRVALLLRTLNTELFPAWLIELASEAAAHIDDKAKDPQ